MKHDNGLCPKQKQAIAYKGRVMPIFESEGGAQNIDLGPQTCHIHDLVTNSGRLSIAGGAKF